MEQKYLDQLTTLGHAGRMAVFRLLVRRYPEHVPAGELSDVLGTKANTMSVYLSALQRVGLIDQQRQGRSLLYRANMGGAEGLVDFLFSDCCRGRPAICAADASANMAPAARADSSPRRYNVLFVCSGNSARSLFAEAILRDLAGDRFNAFSAGTDPARYPNPVALDMLQLKGHDIAALHPKPLSDFQAAKAPQMDFIFTVCDQAANEECPAWNGQPITAHWGLTDPVKVQGEDAQKRLAFQQAYGVLHNRLTLFCALDPDSLSRMSLQTHLDDISEEGLPA